MKRTIALLLAALLLGAAGCAAPVAAPVPTPAPTPEPVGMKKIFGKDITIACDADEQSWFAQGVTAQAEELGIPVVWVKAGETAGDGMIISAPQASFSTRIPAIYHTANVEDALPIPDGCCGVVYDAAAEVEAALAAMYTYPSHEAPVRVLGMFGEQDGEAHAAYLAMAEAGKLQDKGVFVPSDGVIPEQAGRWLRDTLSGITPGRLDTVFSDAPALALEGFAVLKEAKRSDAVEICARGLLPAHVQAMIEDHFLMGTAVGENGYGAGKLAVRMLAHLLAGEAVEESYTLLPLCVRSEDVIELYRAGTTEVNDIMMTLDTQTEQAYQADFLDELRENHTA
ncbi:MAG: hypothetical protein Q4E65_06885 [Clostridia bacterium]|nr:hypothetical protein [Clostridia bacterium]